VPLLLSFLADLAGCSGSNGRCLSGCRRRPFSSRIRQISHGLRLSPASRSGRHPGRNQSRLQRTRVPRPAAAGVQASLQRAALPAELQRGAAEGVGLGAHRVQLQAAPQAVDGSLVDTLHNIDFSLAFPFLRRPVRTREPVLGDHVSSRRFTVGEGCARQPARFPELVTPSKRRSRFLGLQLDPGRR